MFHGFTPETNEFLWGIRLNNSREWFTPRKQIYVSQVYEPLKELAYEVQAQIIEAFPNQPLNCKVTRIYRDVRIPRKDGPYKTSLWFSLRAPGRQWAASPALYFAIDGPGYSTGMDFYCGKPALMECYRQEILRDPKPLEKLARQLNKQDRFQLGGPEYKRSKGDAGPLLAPWFNRKSLFIDWTRAADEGPLYTSELTHQVVEDFKWLMPFYQYFTRFQDVEL
jgi:uncharacterized protein (TIGR02453 family)